MTHHPNDQLRLNVGFMLALPVGESRDFVFECQDVRLEPDLDLASLAGNVYITKAAQGLLIQTAAHATLQGECVRCLTELDLALGTDFTELYAFSRQSVSESGLLLPENAQLDLEPLLREYLLLEVPMSPLCQPDCRGLCPICGENRNETACSHNEEVSDPRFTILKTLLSP
ncbi:MAG: DUF177 domain-containing protein [Anaerolineales bacterium]|nr:DUF177 domain-containing protein [Anaerolineales bacterium]